MNKRVLRKAAAVSVVLTLSFGGVQAAQATQAAPEPPAVIEETASSFQVNEAELRILNQLRAEEGLAAIPDSVESIYLDDSLRMQAYDDAGNSVAVEDVTVGVEPIRTPRAANGFMHNAANIVVGCVKGAVGYNDILKVLEGRSGKLALVKFLAKRVGWGLALSCASGAVSKAMGWQ